MKRARVVASDKPGLVARLKRAGKALKREMLGPWSAMEWPEATGSADLTRLVLDWVVACMSPDDETRGSLKKLRARARDLERNNSYVASYLNLQAVNVVGAHGMGLQAKVRNNDGKLNTMINGKIEEGFKAWADDPVTADGKLNLRDYAQLALNTTSRDGEAFTRLLKGDNFNHGLALGPYDPDLVDETFNRVRRGGDREIRMGVEVDDWGKPVAYHCYDGYSSPFSVGSARERLVIPAEEMIHTYRHRRVNQTRGVTWLGPTMIALRMLEGYEESELVAARVAASKMGFFQSSQPETGGEFGPTVSKEPIRMDANPGTLEQLPVGWEFKEWAPDHPTSQFPAFVKGNLRKIATGLNISYNALASDLEGVNFSSMRSGSQIEREAYKRLQQWWITTFMQRIYREWLASALTRGILVLDQRDFRRFYAVNWKVRGWAQIEPLKEMQAGVMGIDKGLTSRTRILGEQGIDFEEIVEELKEENEIAATAGVSINPTAPGAAPPDDEGDEEDDDDEDDDDKQKTENGNGRAEVIRAARERRR